MNEYSVVMVFVSSILTLQLKYKIMYEALEHWKQYKQVKELNNNLKNLKYLELAMAKLEMDKFINKLAIKNGVTKY